MILFSGVCLNEPRSNESGVASTSNASYKCVLDFGPIRGKFYYFKNLMRRFDGGYKGWKPAARAKSDEVIKLNAEGLGATEIATRLGIGRVSVYRVLCG
jgi:Helix-turn-helix domain of resolvase